MIEFVNVDAVFSFQKPVINIRVRLILLKPRLLKTELKSSENKEHQGVKSSGDYLTGLI